MIDLGRNDEAIESFDKILAPQPDHFHALLGKGSALMGLGDFQGSLEYFDRALLINPRPPGNPDQQGHGSLSVRQIR